MDINDTLLLEDQHARLQALDLQQSFIVQAPAGSGKTELLTQRYLALLSHAQQVPEEVVAITFTRKAAAEMQNRVLKALQSAAETTTESLLTHQRVTHELAGQVLEKDQRLSWNLLANPNRLTILTMDALSARISMRMPLLARYSTSAKIVEDARPYYLQAVQESLIQAQRADSIWQQPIRRLLLHLDNQVSRMEELLIDILARREQWLPHIVPSHQRSASLRTELERGLQNILLEKMQSVRVLINADLAQSLIPIVRFAGKYLAKMNPEHPLACCGELNHLPEVELTHFKYWIGMTSLLLTQEGKWRRRVDKTLGFPAKNSNDSSTESELYKEQLLQILSAVNENEALRLSLAELLICPSADYPEQQWQLIEALIQLLPLLAAQLQLVFGQYNITDFIEINLAALRALGSSEQPTDLALYLDYRINHLLVDEFQDTSMMQFNLLERLVTGWENNDGRTIFLVGDPMQSIYRFRNAEVGLFLRAQQQGIANLKLQSLALRINFRSQMNIVNWTNQIFNDLLPKHADLTVGAVPYTAARAQINQPNSSRINYYPLMRDDEIDEAQQIVQIIQECRQENSMSRIAILVRSRTHLQMITPALRQAKLPYQAVAIESLAERPEIGDLMALTAALLHREDRLNWLVVLRAPWCGLTLADLHAITETAKQQTIWDSLLNYSKISNLTQDGLLRLTRIVPVLSQSMTNRNRMSLSDWIEGTWLALGGPACLNSEGDLANVKNFFDLLLKLEQKELLPQISQIERELQHLFAEPDTDGDPNLQLMTIHKAKGLEFDHVILPGLNRKIASDASRLFLWLERPNLLGSSDLILAPIKPAKTTRDAIYQYLQYVEKEKLNFEAARLLYVAVTRAKQSLHLIATFDTEDHLSVAPASGSFMSMLWPTYQMKSQQVFSSEKVFVHDEKKLTGEYHRSLTRLVNNWVLPKMENIDFQVAEFKSGQIVLQPNVEFTQIIGVTIHHMLEQIATIGIEQWRMTHFPHYQQHCRNYLIQSGISLQQLPVALEIVQQAIENTLQDPTGQWILAENHREAYCEYALTAVLDEQIIHVIMDRVFVDDQDRRWIIDYKNACPQPDFSVQEFMEQQKQYYLPQLNRYAQVMRLQEQREIHLGLYFPLCKNFCTWVYNG